MIPTILAVAGLALATLIYTIHREVRVVLRKITDTQRPAETAPIPPYDDTKLWEAVDRLNTAVAEGIEHVDRKSKRIDGVITGAQRRFESQGYVDPAIEAEAEALPLLHEQSGPSGGMSPLSNDVEAAPNPFAGVPGSLPPGFLDGS